MTELSIDDIIDGAVAKQSTARVCLRGDLLSRHEALEHELAVARRDDETTNEPDRAPALAEQLVALQAEIESLEVEFVFKAIGQKAWSDLLVRHLPSDDDRADGHSFDPRTFPVAAIAATCVEPKGISVAKAEKLFEVMNYGQWSALWGACLAANLVGTDVPFSLAASVVLRGSEMKSAQPAATESLDLSS